MGLDGKATAESVLKGRINSINIICLNAYEIAVKNGFRGTEEEWLASLQGAAGKNGETPYIGGNGNWWIGTEDTGVSATANTTGGSTATILNATIE